MNTFIRPRTGSAVSHRRTVPCGRSFAAELSAGILQRARCADRRGAKGGSEDIAYLCSYDNRQSARRQVQNLRDCCFEICSHVDSLKRSHYPSSSAARVLAWLNEQYTRPDLNIAMAAEQFHISKNTSHSFWKTRQARALPSMWRNCGSPCNGASARLLSWVTEISVQCGFSTQNTFYKAFRRRFGISPSAVRRGDNAG